MRAKTPIQWTDPNEIAEYVSMGFSPTSAKSLSFLNTMEHQESDSLAILANYLVTCSCGESRHLHVADSCRSFIQTHAYGNPEHHVRVKYLGHTSTGHRIA